MLTYGIAYRRYWKQILLNRTFVYLKPVVTKGSDGTERHKTFKIQTPHQETVSAEQGEEHIQVDF